MKSKELAQLLTVITLLGLAPVAATAADPSRACDPAAAAADYDRKADEYEAAAARYRAWARGRAAGRTNTAAVAPLTVTAAPGIRAAATALSLRPLPGSLNDQIGGRT